MRRHKRSEVPAELTRAQARFAAWRRARRPGARIPEPLWKLAVDLAAKCGLSRTATSLHLDYYALKKRLQPAGPAQAAVSARFVELSPPVSGSPSECLLELQHPSGATLRVHVKGGEVPNVAALARELWSGH